MKILSTNEAARFIELESVIRVGQAKFVEVGNALAEIRDKKLYRSFYSNFEQYCLAVWGWSRQRGYQMIQAAEVVGELPPTFALEVGNERDARALAGLTPEDQKEIISEAKKAGVSIAEKASHFCEKPDSIDRTLSTTVDNSDSEPPRVTSNKAASKPAIDHRLDYDPNEQPEESPEKKLTYAELEKRYAECRSSLEMATDENNYLNEQLEQAKEMASSYEEMSKVIDSDDRLKAYRDECKILREKIRLLDVRINQLLIQVQQADAHAKKHKRKLDDYEKRAATT